MARGRAGVTGEGWHGPRGGGEGGERVLEMEMMVMKMAIVLLLMEEVEVMLEMMVMVVAQRWKWCSGDMVVAVVMVKEVVELEEEKKLKVVKMWRKGRSRG